MGANVSNNRAGDTQSQTRDENLEPDGFYARAFARIIRFMLVVALMIIPILFWRTGWQFGLGFMFGCAVAFINFYWLKQTVAGLSDLILKAPGRPPAGRVVRRFLSRYFLIGVGAYVIFRGSHVAVYGLFAGLLLPVAGIFVEAVYELLISFRQAS